MIVVSGINGQTINFDKVYVKSNGIRADISISVPTGRLFERTFRFATRSSDTRLSDQNEVKTLVFTKSLSDAVGYTDISLKYKKENLISSDGGVNTYKLGTIEIPHTIEQFEGKNIFLFGMELRLPANSGPSRIAPLAPMIASSFLDIKVSNTIQNEENIIFQSSFEGPTSFFATAQETTPKKTESPAAFSDLFPSIVNNNINFLFFLDKRRVLQKNTTLFSLLSKTAQERALAGTRLKKQVLVKTGLDLEKFKAAEFLSEEFSLKTTSAPILGLEENIVCFYGQDKIKEYTKNLEYKYKTNLLFINGIYPIVERLINNIKEIKSFESFMRGVFAKTALYDTKNETFKNDTAIAIVKEDLKKDLGVDDTEYFISLLSEVIDMVGAFDSPDAQEQISIAKEQFYKLINLNLKVNKNSFNLFFSFFNNLFSFLQNLFINVGFVLPNSFSGQGKSRQNSNPEKTIITVIHNFDYKFIPEQNSLRYSYLPAKTTDVDFPSYPRDEFNALINQNINKYFLNNPTANQALRAKELQERVEVLPEVGNHLPIMGVKNKNNLIFNNFRPNFFSEIGEIEDARLYYLLAINILKNKLINVKIEKINKLDKESIKLKTKLFNAITDVYNLISFMPFPFSINISDDFRRENADSILQTAISNNELRPTEEEITEIIEAIYNINENVSNLNDLNSTIQNNLEILILFLDYIENIIENPHSYNRNLVDSRLRTPEIFTRAIRKKSGESVESSPGSPITKIDLPYPIYALYESLQSQATPDQGRLTFYWAGGQQLLQSPINSSFIRFNFANIKEVQALTGFSLLDGGEINLKEPIFQKISQFSNEQQLLFCRISNYNIGDEENLWYLNNNNILYLPSETEYFFIKSDE